MDTTSVELARQGLAQYEQDLSPVYTGIQEQLLGVLAVNGRLLEDLQVEADHAKANAELVYTFLKALPNAYTDTDERGRLTDNNPVVSVTDALSARLVQTHVAWRELGDFAKSHLPYYIIGTKSVEPAKKYRADASVLLAPALQIKDGARNFNFRAVPVHRNELDAAEFVQGKALFQTYTEEQMRAMFNPRTKEMEVRNDTPGSLVIGADVYDKQLRKVRKQTPAELIETITAERTISGPHMEYARDGNWIDTFYPRLSNQMMAEYNVPHYLNRLATAFGKTALLDKLLEQHTVEAISPVDQLTQS